MLVSTKIAAQYTGLSEYELRQGFKEGRYPALETGRGNRRRLLRWNLEALDARIHEQMGNAPMVDSSPLQPWTCRKGVS